MSTARQQEFIRDLLEDLGEPDVERALHDREFAACDLDKLSVEEASELIDWLRADRDEMREMEREDRR